MDSSLDTHKDAEVRLALEPIAALADACGVCVEGLIHVNKSTSTDVLTTLMASRAFPAVARAVLIVMQDPDDGFTNRITAGAIVTARRWFAQVGGPTHGVVSSVSAWLVTSMAGWALSSAPLV